MAQQPALNRCDPLTATLRRAEAVTSLQRIAAVIAAPVERWRQSALLKLDAHNLFVQPKHQGTAYEVLLALLLLEQRVPAETTVLFLPADHVVTDEEVMTNSLVTMAEWIGEEPGPVYLLGAVPQGPHDQLGYIVPWHDAMLMPSGVYEFVERPEIPLARKLINDGGLWNTFIFGGSLAALLNLFCPKFDATVAALRAALKSKFVEPELARAFDSLTPADFSEDILAKHIDNLQVLRLLRCGWWPLKSPTVPPTALDGSTSRAETQDSSHEQGQLE